MDRAEFLRSINFPEGTTSEDIVTYFFDQYMLLYNLVGNVKRTSLVNPNLNHISFEIEFFTKESVDDIINVIVNNPTVVIFESTFIVTCTPSGNNTVIITISK